MTVKDAIRRQQTYRAQLILAVLAGMNVWAKRDWKPNVLTRQMARVPDGVPAFPPPGPLGIRSGDLARTVRSEPAIFRNGQFAIALKAGGNGVDYARIHEYGGITGRNYATRIPKRPYFKPAWSETRKQLSEQIQRNVDAITRRVFG